MAKRYLDLGVGIMESEKDGRKKRELSGGDFKEMGCKTHGKLGKSITAGNQ